MRTREAGQNGPAVGTDMRKHACLPQQALPYCTVKYSLALAPACITLIVSAALHHMIAAVGKDIMTEPCLSFTRCSIAAPLTTMGFGCTSVI